MDKKQLEDDQLEWEEVSCEHLVNDEWIDFRRSAYKFPDGTVFEPFYSYSRRDFVVVAAKDTEGNYICVRQYRQGLREVTTEFCAGGIERKDGRSYGDRNHPEMAEDALAAAKRELQEETGYVSTHWRHLLTIPANATIADNYAYLFTADDCVKSKDQDLDETEFLNVKVLREKELNQLISEGKFQQAIHVLAYKLAKESFSSAVSSEL